MVRCTKFSHKVKKKKKTHYLQPKQMGRLVREIPVGFLEGLAVGFGVGFLLGRSEQTHIYLESKIRQASVSTQGN